MERPEIYKSQWQDWKRSQVTKAFIFDLINKREALKEGIADGYCSDLPEVQKTIGKCQALKDAITYAIEEFDAVNDRESSEEQSENEV